MSKGLPGGGCAGNSRVHRIGSAVVEVTPRHYFQLIARRTSGSTKNGEDDELTWIARPRRFWRWRRAKQRRGLTVGPIRNPTPRL